MKKRKFTLSCWEDFLKTNTLEKKILWKENHAICGTSLTTHTILSPIYPQLSDYYSSGKMSPSILTLYNYLKWIKAHSLGQDNWLSHKPQSRTAATQCRQWSKSVTGNCKAIHDQKLTCAEIHCCKTFQVNHYFQNTWGNILTG